MTKIRSVAVGVIPPDRRFILLADISAMKKIFTYSMSIAVAIVATGYSFGQQNRVYNDAHTYAKPVSTLIGSGLDRPLYETQDADVQDVAPQEVVQFL